MKSIPTFVLLLLSPLLTFSQASDVTVSSGSGFFVSSECHIATNNHVIANSKKVIAITATGETLRLEVLKIDVPNDLAVLKSTGKGCKALGIAQTDSLRKGDAVHTLGFPRPNTQGRESKFTTGIVSSLSGIKGDATVLQISTPIQPGNSGGPLLDDAGNVVGVIVAKLRMDNGVVPEAVNYAVKGSMLVELLKSAKPLGLTEYKSAPAQTKALSLPTIAARAEASVVLLVAEKENGIPQVSYAAPKATLTPPNTPPAPPAEVDGQTWIRPIEVLAISPSDSNGKGVTFIAVSGSDVRATTNGRVIWAGGGVDYECKRRIAIEHNASYITQYENLCISFVRFGEVVEQGHVIGTIKSELGYYIYKKNQKLTALDTKQYFPPLQQ